MNALTIVGAKLMHVLCLMRFLLGFRLLNALLPYLYQGLYRVLHGMRGWVLCRKPGLRT